MCTPCGRSAPSTPEQLADVRERGDRELVRLGCDRRQILAASAVAATC